MELTPYQHLLNLKNGSDSSQLLSSYKACKTAQPDIIMKCALKMTTQDALELLTIANNPQSSHGRRSFDCFIKLLNEIHVLPHPILLKLLVFVFSPIMTELLSYLIESKDLLTGYSYIKTLFIKMEEFTTLKLPLLEALGAMNAQHFKTYPQGFLIYANYCKTVSYEFLKCFEYSVPKYVSTEIKKSLDEIRQSCYSKLTINVDLPFTELKALRLPENITWQMYDSLKTNYHSKSFEWVAFSLFKSKNSLDFIHLLIKDCHTEIGQFLNDPDVFATVEDSIVNLSSHLQQKFIKKVIKTLSKRPSEALLQLGLYLFLCIYQNIDLFLYFKKKLTKYDDSNATVKELQQLIEQYPTATEAIECASFYQVVDQVECLGSHPIWQEITNPFNPSQSTISFAFAESASTHVSYNSKQARHLSLYFDHFFVAFEKNSSALPSPNCIAALKRLLLNLDYASYESYTMNIVAFGMKRDKLHLEWLNNHSCHSNKMLINEYQQLVEMKHECISLPILFATTKDMVEVMSELERMQLLDSITQLLIIKRKLAVDKASQICILISYCMPYCYKNKELYKCLHAIYAPPLKQIKGINSFYRDFVKPFQFHCILMILAYVKNYEAWKDEQLEGHLLKLLDLYTSGHLKRRNALLEMLFVQEDKDVMKGLLIKSKAYNTMEQ